MQPIETNRLLLRTWQASDIPLMAEINMNAEVMKYFPSTQDLEKTTSFVERMNLLFEERHYCFFAAEIIETGEFIGFIGLSYQDYDAPNSPFVEIGWRLKPSVWGRGLATEGAKACLEYAFEELNLEEIYSITPAVNLPSERVMKKLGMTRLLEFEHPALLEFEELKTCVMYRVKVKE